MTNKILLLQGEQAKSITTSSTDYITFMTSDILPSPLKASASSVTSTNYAAWKAFNGTNINNSDCWLTAANVNSGQLTIDYSVKKKINKVSITSRNDATASTLSPKKFNIEGSDDGVGWDILYTVDNEIGWTANQKRAYMIPNEHEYIKYRINVIDNNGGTQLSIGEVLFSYVDLTFSDIEKTEQNFIDFGISLTELAQLPYYKLRGVFGNTLGIAYFTDDPSKTEAKLEITANYSPLDEIEEDFEIVTWTDEAGTHVARTLSMNALPKPQFIKQINPIDKSENFKSYNVTGTKNKPIFLLSSDKNTWKKWDGTGFIKANSQIESMTGTELEAITPQQWKLWTEDKIYLGVFVDQNQIVNSISYTDLVPKESTQISDTRLYILNTVSTINVNFAGSTLTGTIDDEDDGKVQYRVILNGENYYPKDGSFTKLSLAPLDIAITIANEDILIDQNNTLRVEFKDFWGTTDFWQQNFFGTYSGLLFLDETGQYYSDNIGKILKYLDFGILIAGQTTVEQAVVLRNTYGYSVKDVKIRANQSELPSGLKVQFGTNDTSFEAVDSLSFKGVMADGEEKKFYMRLSSILGVTPSKTGEFDILVNATKVENTTE